MASGLAIPPAASPFTHLRAASGSWPRSAPATSPPAAAATSARSGERYLGQDRALLRFHERDPDEQKVQPERDEAQQAEAEALARITGELTGGGPATGDESAGNLQD